jgi:hypothetical protein
VSSNKRFLHQSYADGPNYGRVFRDESQRRVHCPDLTLPAEPTLDVFLNGGSIIIVLLLILFIVDVL